MAVSIIYETHSTTTDNESGIATGWLPGALSALGRRQAAELGDRRKADGVAAVYSSDLARSVETAEIAFGSAGISIHRDERLRECNYGRFNGAPVTDVHAMRARHITEPFPDGESYHDVVERTRSLLDDLASAHDGEVVVLIGHSANQVALDVLLHGKELADLLGPEPFEWRPGWNYTL